MDRRKRKSRKAILDACIILSKQKEFPKITVNEIVEHADLNRGTFYLHFLDKYDMMTSFENEMLEKIEAVMLEHLPKEKFVENFIQSRYDTLVHLLTCYEENKDLLYLLLKSSHNSSFQIRLRDMLSSLLIDTILPQLKVGPTTVPTEIFSMFFTSMSLNLAEYAYDSKIEIDIEKHAKILIDMAVHGPLKALGVFPDLEPNKKASPTSK